jgi:hypothetical protein
MSVGIILVTEKTLLTKNRCFVETALQLLPQQNATRLTRCPPKTLDAFASVAPERGSQHIYALRDKFTQTLTGDHLTLIDSQNSQ